MPHPFFYILFLLLSACADESPLGVLPSISSLAAENGKAEGPISGNTLVTIRGTNFADDAAVRFGNLEATAVTVQDETRLTATTDSVFRSALVSVSITTGGQIAFAPEAFVYTPLIAFASNRTESFEIFTMSVDGNTPASPAPTRLTNSEAGITNEAPVFSLDGKKILFTTNRTDNFELFVMGRDGSNPVNLTDNGGVDQEAAFSPNGEQIVFISNRVDASSNPEGDFEIFLMDQNGGNLSQVTTNNSDEGRPSFSPDGKRILFTSDRDGDRELFLINPDGTAELALTDNLNDDHGASFSPDGQQILFVSDQSGMNELHIIDKDGTNPLQLTTNQGNVTTPAFLAVPTQGLKVLFSSDQTGNREVFVISCNGDQSHAITTCDESSTTNLSLNTASEIAPSPSP